MIFDNIKNASNYYVLSTYFKQALEYLQKTDLSNYAVGVYPIKDQDIFFKIEEYSTQNSNTKQYEAHKKYADIQFIISGEEYMSCANIKDKKIIKAYSCEQDISFYRGEITNLIKLSPSDFCIFLPSEAHVSGINNYQPVKVKKVIMKINMLARLI